MGFSRNRAWDGDWMPEPETPLQRLSRFSPMQAQVGASDEKPTKCPRCGCSEVAVEEFRYPNFMRWKACCAQCMHTWATGPTAPSPEDIEQMSRPLNLTEEDRESVRGLTREITGGWGWLFEER